MPFLKILVYSANANKFDSIKIKPGIEEINIP